MVLFLTWFIFGHVFMHLYVNDSVSASRSCRTQNAITFEQTVDSGRVLARSLQGQHADK